MERRNAPTHMEIVDVFYAVPEQYRVPENWSWTPEALDIIREIGEKPMEKLRDILESGSIRRYHTVPRFDSQNVAEHSWRMAAILHYLKPTISREALLAALYHDVPERATGDVPANTKWAYPELGKMLKRIEDRELHRLGILNTVPEEERDFVHLADGLECMWHCLDMRTAGNQNADVIFSRMLERLQQDFPHRMEGQVRAMIVWLVEQYCVVGYPQATNALEGVLDELTRKA